MPTTLPNQYAFVPNDTEDELLLEDETRSVEPAIEERVAEYKFSRILGVQIVDLGAGLRELHLTGWIHASDASALRSAIAAMEAFRRKLGTLTLRGAEDVWYNVRIKGKPGYGQRTPPQADGTVHCTYSIVFQELDSTVPV